MIIQRLKKLREVMLNRKAEKEAKLIAEANKFFDELIKKRLLEAKQLDEEIANYWS